MLQASVYHLLCLAAPLFAITGCGQELAPREPIIEWSAVALPEGSLNVALIRPDDESGGPHPVIFALPWGAGTADLVITFLQSYWLTEPAARGYYVVAPEVRGSTLVDSAHEVIPAVFDWMADELVFDADRVALVGASNGGRGMFFAAVSQPDRFRALLGLPGQYSGDAANMSVLAGKPIRLLVGEFDDGWVAGSEATVAALASQGISAELEIVAGQGHVMSLDASVLLDWIDGALGR